MAHASNIAPLSHIGPLVNSSYTKISVAQQSHVMESPNSAIILAYIQQKLRILPSLYSTYEAGIRAVFDLVDQDFEPNQRPLVMGLFWEVFYGLHADKEYVGNAGSTDVWAQWREECQIHLTNYLMSQDVAPQYTNTSTPSNAIYSAKVDNTPRKPQSNNARDSDVGCNNLSFGTPFPTHCGRARLVDIPPYGSRSHLDVTSDSMLDISPIPELDILPEIRAESRQKWRRNSLSSGITVDNIQAQYRIGQDVGTPRYSGIDNLKGRPVHGPPARLRKAASEDDHAFGREVVGVPENTRAANRPHSDYIGDLLLPIREIGKVRGTAKPVDHARSFESPRGPGYLIFPEEAERQFPGAPKTKHNSSKFLPEVFSHKLLPGMRKPRTSGYDYQEGGYHRISGDLVGQSLERSLHTKANETSFFGKTIKDIPSVDVKAAAKLCVNTGFIPCITLR